MVSILPMDLISQILFRLPAKSLARFKCVAKHWNSHITHPNFIKRHLSLALSSPVQNRLLVVSRGSHLEVSSTGFNPNSVNFNDKSSKFELPSELDGLHAVICGSVNGLLLLSCSVNGETVWSGNKRYKLLLWNPSTNAYYLVPHDPFPFHSRHISFGFGYVESEDDYKIVRITDFVSPNTDHDAAHVVNDDVNVNVNVNDNDNEDGEDNNDDGDTDVENGNGNDDDNGGVGHAGHDLVVGNGNEGGVDENDHVHVMGTLFREICVYSLKEDKWSMLYIAYTEDMMIYDGHGAVINNISHWVFWHPYEGGKYRIRGFHLGCYMWTKFLPLPDLLANDSDHVRIQDVVNLGVLDGSLCLVTKILPQFDSNYVWIMKDYGVKDSWTKVFCISDANVVGPLMSVPIVYSRERDELLLRKANEDGLFWYNMEDKMLKFVPEVVSDIPIVDVGVGVGTLISPNPDKTNGSDGRDKDNDLEEDKTGGSVKESIDDNGNGDGDDNDKSYYEYDPDKELKGKACFHCLVCCQCHC